ncbi:hypothetical protein SFHH103_04051 (plasmid) [Sinorhizobium fredii HH103]|uniref:site-specific DNA-methyltransferase (adenine-specific) n=1 Tax=Sinorhizobium fredii (strain HH103) TaxID=1117943 RepID=G9ABW3_SINF1|nr:hypothetical protein SFHH103_04051 [Sinorhizobium fredii HH103]
MTSLAFRQALEATGYLDAQGRAAPGLNESGHEVPARLRAVFQDERVGLHADAVFSAQGAPTSIFKDAGHQPPTVEDLRAWYEAAWNVGVAPLLWIVTPTDIRLYDCYASPPDQAHDAEPPELGRFMLNAPELLLALDAACGRLATETGAFWSSPIGAKINRRHRVDRELLAEISALEHRLIELTGPEVPNEKRSLARDLAQRFIGRCIFTSYLLDRGLAQPFLPDDLPADLAQIFSTPATAFRLFAWLRSTFNGDLFPMDDPGAEREHLSEAHLGLLRDFIEGRSLIPERKGQGRLFRFRFNAIPVDLISSIYQQFARTSAADDAEAQGLHYTPIELVHLTLDPVFEQLPGSARIVDPACGSGAFLVEAFRRLVWRATGGKPASRQLVREILYGQLFGIDINKSALGIAAFSLYLAALELDQEPVENLRDLKFDHLIGQTLFEADSLAEPLPAPIASNEFDAVVGNPPWTFVGQSGASPKRTRDEATARPRRSPDQAFLALAARLAGDSGRIGMIMKATPFFSKDVHAVDARRALLKKLAPAALINLSYLRREELFPDAKGPALLFLARCALSTASERLLVGSIPWTPDFRRTGIFHVGPGEIRSIPLDRVLAVPPFLKAATFGTVRDGWLISRLEQEFPTLDTCLTAVGILPRHHRGQGFKVNGAAQFATPEDYFELPVATPENFRPMRLPTEGLDKLTRATLHRPRTRSIFKGPILLCSKVASDASLERGRFSATVIETDALFTESFTGISFAESDSELAYVLNAILNSSLTAFQLALGGPTWGLERPTVLPHDLLSIRVPFFGDMDRKRMAAVIEAERAVAADPTDHDLLAVLDQAVFDLYDLEPDEAVLAADATDRARYLIYENRKERCGFVMPPRSPDLRAYASQLVSVVNAYLRARGERHLQAHIYDRALDKTDWTRGIPGVTAVRFSMAPGRPDGINDPLDGDPEDLAALGNLLRGGFETVVPPYLNERRQLRIYGDDCLFILKPSEVRYWTRTAGLNDADIILADHWVRRRDAVVRA